MKTPYSPRSYWTEVADTFGRSDVDGLAPVLHPNVPDWYNRTIDSVQFRAVLRALDVVKLVPGARILDVGCGTGRWLRRYQAMGLRPTGVDATLKMLSLARENCTRPALVAGESFRLPFADATFDAASDITVIQHLLPESRPQALSEMLRVIRPGGRLILMELIRGNGAHIFPLPAQEWITATTSCGAGLISWFGEEYMLVDRAFVHIAQSFFGRNGSSGDGKNVQPKLLSARNPAARSTYWKIRRLTAPLSGRMESAVEMLFPRSLATHGVFIFAKDGAET